MNDEYWMRHALKLAEKAESLGEVPVGAVIVKDDEILAEGWNQPILSNDATAHAEIMVLRAAGEMLNNYRITDAELFVTLEPCSMCVGALIHARIKRVVFAASEPRTGALGGAFNLLESNDHNHIFDVDSGVLADESRNLIQTFFKIRRK
ncbi:MAG: tRNA adenosine(34) deaminase TadA [Gammaproteobacteria bacterium]|nr:tRNA adenosine(34) deaminase TadA [Gammaproteobacteria bacterium]